MKKTIMILIFSLVFMLQVYAEQTFNASVNQEEVIVTVSGTTGANSYVMCTVLKPSKDETEPYTLLDMKENTDIVAGFVQQFSDEEGNFKLTIKLADDSISGIYPVKIGFENTFTDEDARTVFIELLSKDEYIEMMQAANSITKEKAEDFIDKYSKSLSLETDTEYRDLKSAVLSQFVKEIKEIKEKKTIDDSGEIIGSWNKALVVVAIKNRSGKAVTDILKKFSEELEIDYSSIPDNAVQKFSETVVSYKDKINVSSDISKLLPELIAVSAVNSASRGEMTDVLKEYASELGISITDAYLKNYIHINMHLANMNFKDANAFKIAYEKALSGETTSGGSIGKITGGTVGAKEIASNSFEEQTANSSLPFTDLNNSLWAKAAIDELYKRGIINGITDTLFYPESEITREEFIKMLVVATGKFDRNATVDFLDADINAWYYPYIASAKQFGITVGIGNNNFGIGQRITRQDMAVMIYRTIKDSGIELKYSKDRNTNYFFDTDLTEIMELYRACIINGKTDGYFAPHDNSTRAEAAKIIFEMLNVIKR